MPQGITRHDCIRVAILAAATLVAAAGAAFFSADRGQASLAQSSSTKVMKVSDNFFTPPSLSARVGDRIRFRSWNSAFGGTITDFHNAVLTRPYPKKVKPGAFSSGIESTSLSWTTPKFTVPGTYHFTCINHSLEMRATIRVRR